MRIKGSRKASTIFYNYFSVGRLRYPGGRVRHNC